MTGMEIAQRIFEDWKLMGARLFATGKKLIRKLFGDRKQMIVQPFAKRCIFCRQQNRDGELLTCVARRNSYEERTYRYHESCMVEVMKNPEEHGHQAADLVIDIHNCIARRDRDHRLTEEWHAMKLQQVAVLWERKIDGKEGS